MKKTLLVLAASVLCLAGCVTSHAYVYDSEGRIVKESSSSVVIGQWCIPPIQVLLPFSIPCMWDYPQWYWAQPPRR